MCLSVPGCCWGRLSDSFPFQSLMFLFLQKVAFRNPVIWDLSLVSCLSHMDSSYSSICCSACPVMNFQSMEGLGWNAWLHHLSGFLLCKGLLVMTLGYLTNVIDVRIAATSLSWWHWKVTWMSGLTRCQFLVSSHMTRWRKLFLNSDSQRVSKRACQWSIRF